MTVNEINFGQSQQFMTANCSPKPELSVYEDLPLKRQFLQ